MIIREISNCCGAPIMEHTEDICSSCGEHCEVVEEEGDTPFFNRLNDEIGNLSFINWKEDDDHPELHVSEG